MKQFLAGLVNLGPWGLFVGAFLDGAGLPIPGGVDVLVVFLSTRLPHQALWLTTVAVVGSVIGNFLLFLLARRGGHAFLEKRSSKRSQRFRHWFHRYGLMTVFVAALVPLPVMPLKIFVLSAGALGSHPLRFVLIFLAARIPRYLGLALLGRAMGMDAIAFLKQHVWYLVGFACLLLLVLTLIMRHMDRSHPTETT